MGKLLLVLSSALLLAMFSAAQQNATGPTVGSTTENPKDGQQYKWLPPGKLKTVCSRQKSGCADPTQPVLVNIEKGFWLGATECTVGAFKRFAAATGNKMPPPSMWNDRELNPGWRDDRMPVLRVDEQEAQSFCQWVGGRLPTEVEWEYAARAGDVTTQPTDALDTVAWYADNSGETMIDSAALSKTMDDKSLAARKFENHNGPHEVGLKKPNRWGLYDMLGNVWEWTSDSFAPGGSMLALRGGSWGNAPQLVRVTARGEAEPTHRSNSIGFRCLIDRP